jgi:hypothetical protein
MKKKQIKISLMLIFLFGANILFAQLVSTTTQVLSSPTYGSAVVVPISNAGITATYGNVQTASFKITYDPAVLTYSSVSDYSLAFTGWSRAVNTSVVGVVEVNLSEESLIGNALPDGLTFNVNFTIKGGSTPINITLAEFLGSDWETYNSPVSNGSVSGYANLTASNGEWNTPATWDGNVVPGLGQNAIIATGGTVTKSAGGAADCHNLTINDGGKLTLSPTYTLNVHGNLEIASGGSFIQSGTLAVTGTTTVKRAIGGTNWADNNDGWHLLSSPVAAQAISPNFVTPNVTNVGSNRYDFYAWGETTHEWLNQKVGGMTNFEVGQGYLVAYESGGTKEFVGSLNNADKSVTLTKTGVDATSGYNLLGNPFSSALTWATGWTLTNIGPAATYIWSNSMQDYDLISVGEAIPAENGFMVYTSVASQSLTIPKAARVHSATAWYKATTTQIKLIAHDLDKGSSKASIIRFDPNATAGFDLAYDAYNLSGFAPKFYSAANGEQFGLNTLPEAKDGLVIPFGFVKNSATNYTIELAQSLDGVVLALRDKKTNTTVNLSKNPVYTFTSTEGDDANRFELLFGSQLGVNDSKALASAYAYSVDNRIVINNVNGDTQMDIINVQGQLLKKYDFFSNGSHEVSVNLATGVYMIRLSNGGELRTMKVFVK